MATPLNLGATVILGGTGFLGAHLVASAYREARELATMADPTGPPVVGVGRRPEAAPSFTNPRDERVYVGCDLDRPGALEELLARHDPAQVVNAAALTRVSDCAAEPDLARLRNAELPARAARWCAERGRRLLHVSTDLVFGTAPAPRGGFREEDEPGPVSVYGETKLAGERAVLAVHPAALVVRLPLLYGNSGGRGLGASDSLVEAVHRGEKPSLFADEFRTPLEVTCAAEALIELLHQDVAGVLHVAGPERVHRLTLGLAALRAMGLDDSQARAEVTEARQADRPELGPRPADVSLDRRRALHLLATELVGVHEGMRVAMG